MFYMGGKIDEIGQWQNRARCGQEVIYRKLSTVRPLLPFLVTNYSLYCMQSQKNFFKNIYIFYIFVALN